MLVFREVRLPDGTEVVEVEEQHRGGSETQVTYQYYKWWGIVPLGRVRKNAFETDYWGRIKGIEVIG